MSFELTPSQKEFFEHVGTSTSGISVLRGYAGTGKTRTLAEIVEQLPFKNILMIAPTAAAISVLRQKLPSQLGKVMNYSTLSSIVENPSESLEFFNKQFKLIDSKIGELENFLTKLKIWDDDLIFRKTMYVRDENGDLSETEKIIFNENLFKKLTYERFKGNSRGQFRVVPTFDFKPIETIVGLLSPYDLIMIDEMSMVGQSKMSQITRALDLLNGRSTEEGVNISKIKNIPLILAGDKGQLPPVDDELNHYFKVDDIHKVDADKVVELTEILRSTDDIAKVAQMIRKGVPLETIARSSRFEDSHLVDYNIDEFIRLNGDLLRNCDVAITYTNNDVLKLGQSIRSLKGFHGDTLNEGETIIVTKNSDKDNKGRVVFANGEEYKVVKVFDENYLTDLFENGIYANLKNKGRMEQSVYDNAYAYVLSGKVRLIMIENRLGEQFEVFVSTKVSDNGSYDFKLMYDDFKSLASISNFHHQMIQVDFGYARTIHKSQGSEWNDVVIWLTKKHDWIMSKSGNKTSLPYTAYTRSAKKANFYYSTNFS